MPNACVSVRRLCRGAAKAQLDIVQQRAPMSMRTGSVVEKGARGLGISAYFVGPSGTGKTLTAALLANDTNLDR